MSEENTVYSGFILKAIKLDDPDLPIIIRVACFKKRSDFRRILPLKVVKDYDFSYGQIIHFSPRDGNLEENSFVTIHEDTKPFSEHQKDFRTMIVHVLKDVPVSAEDLPESGIYKHPDLGIMKDKESTIKPGMMDEIFINVLIIKDSFEVYVRGAEHEKTGTPPEESIAELKKFERIHEVIRCEHEYNKAAENATWRKIGFLQLIDYNKESFQGYKPIFKLLDQQNLEVFNKQKKNSEVAMIQVVEIDGKYQDASEVQLATLIENQENIGERCVMAYLKAAYRHKFEQIFEIGALFRFESALSEKTGYFWEKQKHKNNELFEHTLYRSTEKEIEEMKIMDLIDSRMKSEGEVLKDRGSQQNSLNETQYKALKMALNEQRKVVCIQGPPGTGKTFVLAHILATLIFGEKQAIVLTPTKEALKNIMIMTEKVIKEKNLECHDKTLMDQVKFEKAVNNSPAAEDAKEKIAQWDENFKNNMLKFADFYDMKTNLINRTFAEVGTEIMKQTRIVFATIQSSFVDTTMKYKIFNPCMCVIDEAAQVMETQTWPAVIRMKRIILAGDPKQLPALVLSAKAKAAKLEDSIMDRIIHNKEKFSWIMLDEQYRCHPNIIAWSNKSFYDGALKNKTSEDNTIRNNFKIEAPPQFRNLFDAAVLVDTSSETDPDRRETLHELFTVGPSPNEDGGSSRSYKNEGEARLVLLHYKHLRELGIEAKNIAIITPYRAQTELIKQGMANIIEDDGDLSCSETKIGTVDGVQGQEYDCVIFSMVRSNPRNAMGFVGDLRRLNVAMTRAKRHLMFIGNGCLLANHLSPQIQNLFHEFHKNDRVFHPQNVGYLPA
ncbi:hypothetical protein CAEBREN_16388 [Caenorhabditis brenneri]|uniref:Helicase ATP-binding domain-containing protein n=1 Tax=Caenorhabditis brenneri TaxID=135651 RepID=G0NI39_CAEBE|nr:hypothetical protein CAEBREN_16388 [Caenorhabditis brenneri]